MSFSKYTDVRDAINAGRVFTSYAYLSRNSSTAGLWDGTPVYFASGDAPASTPGTAFSNKGLNFPNTTGTKHLISMEVMVNTTGGASGTGVGVVMLYDRLVGVGPILTTSTGVKTVNSAALPRYTSGEGVIAVLEQVAAINSGCTINLDSYTNAAGTTGQQGPSIVIANRTNGWSLPGVQVGDRGCKSVESINVTAASVTTGSVNVVLIKPLAMMTMAQFTTNRREHVLQLTSPAQIFDGASLELAVLPSTGILTNNLTVALKFAYSS